MLLVPISIAVLLAMAPAQAPPAKSQSRRPPAAARTPKPQPDALPVQVMLDKGMSNRDIATELQISEHTVKVHLWRLFRRLNVKSRSQASHLARTQGLL